MRPHADIEGCRAAHDLLAFTDEIYEQSKYDVDHIPLATLPGMADRTVSILLCVTYHSTGMRRRTRAPYA